MVHFRKIKKFRFLVIFIIIIFTTSIYFWFLNSHKVEGWNQYRSPSNSNEFTLNPVFLNTDSPVVQRYDALFNYFLIGFMRDASPQFERINYSGAGSVNGFSISGLEGFARTGSLFAAWIYSGRSSIVKNGFSGVNVNIIDTLKQGLLAGTNKNSATYWGEITNFDQRIVESADVARIIWLTKAVIWEKLSAHEKEQIASWLKGALHSKVHPNNWRLFPVTVGLILQNLGYPNVNVPLDLYTEFKKSYLGKGWFFDAPEGIDYYNAWGISYELLWIQMVKPDHDTLFIQTAINESAAIVSHLISPSGIPMMGRSTCYRTAIPVPIIGKTFILSDAASAGLGRHALDQVWLHFVRRGALQDGHLTQGYYKDNLRFVEGYTGPGSCHWGLRSLVLAYMQPSNSPFWTAPVELLPVEKTNYQLSLPEIGWQIVGKKETGTITLEIPENTALTFPIESQSLFKKIDETLTMRPRRPYNHDPKYHQRYYSSNNPYMENP